MSSVFAAALGAFLVCRLLTDRSMCTVTKGDEAGQQFAVKYLKRETMVDLHHFKHGAADLAVEAKYVQS